SVSPGRKGGHDALALYADGAERNSGDRGGTRGDSGAGCGVSAGGADPVGVRSGEDRRGDGESDECGAAGGGGGYGGPGFVDERRGAGKVSWGVRGLGLGRGTCPVAAGVIPSPDSPGRLPIGRGFTIF